MMNQVRSGDAMLTDWRGAAGRFEAALGGAVLGQTRAIRLLTIALFARGHVLLEGDVGVGKTTLLRAVARALGGAYERVEGTVDMMPTDLVYHTYLAEDGRPRVEPGPVLRQSEDLSIFFFNEINRARPQVHALLLRLMAERTLTAFNREYRFPNLQVFADRNRVEREETFELPAAARDRAWLEGRDWMVPEDIRAIFPEVMAHRVFLEPIYEMRRAAIVPELCRAVFETVPAP